MRILLVAENEDDFPPSLELPSDTLPQRFELEWVGNYRNGLDLLMHGDFDICILDCAAGKRGGGELLKRVEANGCKVPIVLCKGHDDDPATVKSPVYPSDVIDYDDALVFVREIMDRKKLEEDVFKEKKLKAMGIFAGGVAHDFNNLLSVILGGVDLTMDDVEPGSSAFHWLNEARKAVLQASVLTKKFIVFSRGETLQRRKTSIEELLTKAARLVLNGSNVRCEFSFQKDLWELEVDPDQMSQAICNLITNAKEAMPLGGLMEISAENVEAGPEHSETLLQRKEGRHILLRIKDHGCGIAQENLYNVFDPYFSTKKKGSQKGMGLGLAIIRLSRILVELSE